MKTKIVVGLGWGDEGKGLTTNYLCQKSLNPIVVRFSGGQQAGHNVQIGDKTHEHRSFGSGTISGYPSYFTEHTCFYPPSIEKEYDILSYKGIFPELFIHPLAKMTTQYDVAYNRVRESSLRHGSCGLGVGATFSRNADCYKIHAIDIMYNDILYKKLEAVKDYYMRKLVAEGYSVDEIERFKAISVIEGQELMWALSSRKFYIRPYSMLKEYSNIIFEGSQGIMLDMDIGIFPNVTYANTTSKNALAICKELGSNPEIFYITRCYQTRHGNGWMKESKPISLINNEKETNVTNEWQGVFRTAELDYNLLRYAIYCDNAFSDGCEKHLVVTCLDQRPDFQFKEESFPMMRSILKSYSPDSAELTVQHTP